MSTRRLASPARWIACGALNPRPDLVVATGDLVDAGSAAEYGHLRRLLAPLDLPLFLLPGNHDSRDELARAFPDHAYLPRDGGSWSIASRTGRCG